jgi:hypothetical protein
VQLVRRVRSPRLRFERIKDHLPPATVASLSFTPPGLLENLDQVQIPRVAGVFDTLSNMVGSEERLLQSRLAALVGPDSRTLFALVYDSDVRARSMAFADGSKAITVSTGLLRFFAAYCRILACHVNCSPFSGLPTLPPLAGFSTTPAPFPDAQFAAVALFTNYIKLGISLETVAPTPTQAALGVKLFLALLDFVLAHEIAHLRHQHVRGRRSSIKDEYVADRYGVRYAVKQHGHGAALCGVEIFFSAAVGIYRHLDLGACGLMKERERRLYPVTWQLPFVGVDQRIWRLARAFRKTSVGCSNASLDSGLGRTVLDAAVDQQSDDTKFLDLTLRWFLVDIPDRAIEYLARLARAAITVDSPNLTGQERVHRFRSAYTDSSARGSLRRLSLLHDVLDDHSRLDIEREVADDLRASGQ